MIISVEVPHKTKNRPSMWPTYTTPGYTPEGVHVSTL